ncbi:MAG: sigma 54-interacting transcriptional regulator, partial [Bacillota bacterium]|nr:sigma 54-interacting transcriptional regulator [Bacillota bacterium]
IYVNGAATRLENLAKEEMVGKTIQEIYSLTEFNANRNSPTLEALWQEEAIENKNLEWFGAEGKIINAITSAYPIKQDGKTRGVYSFAENIQDLKTRLVEIGAFHKKKTYRLRKKILKNGTSYIFDDIIGDSEAILSTITIARRFAAKKLPVMIYGETGTGKELFAQSIHNASSFVSGPFVAINCAAIPDNLLESMLFGTVKGAFTGSLDSPGLFEKAENGSVFLDEINSMPINLQAKLLRALQEKEIRRIGDSKTRKINCRIISAINQHPNEAVTDGNLREDLFYRLSTGMLLIPPLRERGNDYEALANYIIGKCNEDMDTVVDAMSPAMKELLKSYYWPGNVRELTNIIESAMNMTSEGERILDISHLPTYLKNHFKEEIAAMPHTEQVFNLVNKERFTNYPTMSFNGSFNDMLRDYEKNLLELALASTQGNITKCGEKLQLSRQNLTAKLKKHNINIGKFRKHHS